MPNTDSIIGAVCSAIDLSRMTPALSAVWAVVCPQPHSGFPYLVVRWPRTRFQWTQESNYVEKPCLLLEIYHTEVAPAETGLRNIVGDLKDQELLLLGNNPIQMFPVDFYVRDEPSLSTDVKVVFRMVAVLEIWVNRA